MVADLVAEQDELDRIVAGLTPDQWGLATPSPGWTVADQIGHLTYFDTAAAVAIEEPSRFVERRRRLQEVMRDDSDGAAMDAATLAEARDRSPGESLRAWRAGRAALARAALGLEPDARVPWYGPSMGAVSFMTARVMEYWAHGQDVVDAVAAVRPATDRLVHVAQLGVITRGWSYTVRGLQPSEVPVRVQLDLPGGGSRAWGDADAVESITGPIEDFCLVVTQRRHPEDTRLVAVGDAASEWLRLAQVFAGRPTDGPVP